VKEKVSQCKMEKRNSLDEPVLMVPEGQAGGDPVYMRNGKTWKLIATFSP